MATPDSPKDPHAHNRQKMERWLSSLSERLSAKREKPGEKDVPGAAPACQGPCADAEWRAHLDIPGGVLCVSVAPSKNEQAEKHRDVTVAMTYVDDQGQTQFVDMVLCDSEMRWVLESLYHAPIWD